MTPFVSFLTGIAVGLFLAMLIAGAIDRIVGPRL